MKKIKIGILGYGNLGRGVELAVNASPDMELACVFTRRKPDSVKILTPSAAVLKADEILSWKGKLDVLILCGGSAVDLPEQTPLYAKHFNTVDSFDTHAKIPQHFKSVDMSARDGGKVSIISVGWDPGMFSAMRLYSECILPDGNSYTFWGQGVSQGHSDAIRRIDGVVNAKQYTVPVDNSVKSVKNGENPILTDRQKHLRECYIVAADGADKAAIENKIKTMPNYFADYDTTVHFISEEEFNKKHGGMPHGGFVLRSGSTDNGNNKHLIEYSLRLDSNPEFTGGILAAYARAASRMSDEGAVGAKTVFDIAPAYLSCKTGEELIKHLL